VDDAPAGQVWPAPTHQENTAPHNFTLRVSTLLCTLVALAATGTGALAAPGFGPALSDNGTGVTDGTFLGAPDGNFAGLGSQSLTYSFGDNLIVNRPGAVDLNVYEVDFGGPEFEFLEVLVSTDGVSFSSVKVSMSTRRDREICRAAFRPHRRRRLAASCGLPGSQWIGAPVTSFRIHPPWAEGHSAVRVPRSGRSRRRRRATPYARTRRPGATSPQT
jgi:hypothetical protein